MNNTIKSKKNNDTVILNIVAILSILWLIAEILYCLSLYNINPLDDAKSKYARELEIGFGFNKAPTSYLLILIIISIFLRTRWLFNYNKKNTSSFLLFYVGQLLAITITFKTTYFVHSNSFFLAIQIALLIAFSYVNRTLFENLNLTKNKQIAFYILITFALFLSFTTLINVTRILNLNLKNSLFSLCLIVLTAISIVSILVAFFRKYRSLLFYIIAQILVIVLFTVDFITDMKYNAESSDVAEQMKIYYIDNIVPILILITGFSILVAYIYKQDKKTLKMIEAIGEKENLI